MSHHTKWPINLSLEDLSKCNGVVMWQSSPLSLLAFRSFLWVGFWQWHIFFPSFVKGTYHWSISSTCDTFPGNPSPRDKHTAFTSFCSVQETKQQTKIPANFSLLFISIFLLILSLWFPFLMLYWLPRCKRYCFFFNVFSSAYLRNDWAPRSNPEFLNL